MAKLKQLHPITLTKPNINTQQLFCSCGWKGTLWGTPHLDPHESNTTCIERMLHLLEELEVIQGDTVRT